MGQKGLWTKRPLGPLGVLGHWTYLPFGLSVADPFADAFGDPLIIRNNTIDITMNFNVSTAAVVARSGAGDGIYLGVNAFSAMFTTTERVKRRRRGAWN